jgi:S-adenosylmethionine decarboxylase proenzyme
MRVREQPMLYSVDLSGCTEMHQWQPAAINAAFAAALERAGATVVQTIAHDFPGNGLTSVLILAESHAILHTWPETGTVNIDIFSCSSRLRSRAAIDEIARAFGASAVSVQEIPRADGHGPPASPRQ